MPARTKHPIAIAPLETKIETRNGGSITKNNTTPEIIAKTLATIATATLTPRNWRIANRPLTVCDG